jgi:hypothetical protein
VECIQFLSLIKSPLTGKYRYDDFILNSTGTGSEFIYNERGLNKNRHQIKCIGDRFYNIPVRKSLFRALNKLSSLLGITIVLKGLV